MNILSRANWRGFDDPGKDLRDLALLAAILLAAYGAALLIPFAHHDDYYYFAYDDRSSWLHHPQYLITQFTGRHLYKLIATPIAAVLWEVSDFTLVRTGFIVALAFPALVVMRVLERLDVPRWHAMAVAGGMFLLPGIQAGVIWVTLAPCVAALIFSLLAGHAAISLEPGVPREKGARMRAAATAAVSIALLLAALFVYPPWAMFFIVPVFARTLLGRAEGLRRLCARLTIEGGIFAMATVMYFALHKFVLLPAFAARHPDHYARWVKAGAYDFALTTDLVASARRFTDGVVGTGTKLWSLYASWEVVAGVLTLIALGGLVSLRGVRRGAIAGGEWVARAGALLALSAASVLPVLAAAGTHTGYRVILPFSAVLLLALYAAAATLVREGMPAHRWRGTVLSGLVLCAVMLAAATACVNVRASAQNANLELSLLRAALLERLDRGHSLCHVHFVVTRPQRSFLDLPALGDEFNVNSSAYRLNLPWMVRAALAGVAADRRSLHVTPKRPRDLSRECIDGRAGITVTTGEIGEPYYAFPQTVLIDLNDYLPRASKADVGRAH